jgi:hypothetical protein
LWFIERARSFVKSTVLATQNDLLPHTKSKYLCLLVPTTQTDSFICPQLAETVPQEACGAKITCLINRNELESITGDLARIATISEKMANEYKTMSKGFK